MIVDCAVYLEGKRLPGDFTAQEAAAKQREHEKAFAWIGLHEPTPEEFDVVRSEFALVLEALPDRPKSFMVYFLEGTDEFTPESRVEFERILAELRERGAPDVMVIGHTDRVGAAQFNDRLSLQRAERVRGELVGLGIPEARIRTAGRGEREPLVVTDDEVAEPRNRRVEINVR